MRVITTIGAILVLSLQLTGCGGSGEGAAIRFQDGSKEAYLIVLMDPAPVPYTLRLIHFNPEQNSLRHGVFDTPRDFDGGNSNQPTYVARVIDPGTYVISSMTQQKMWGACFNNDTRQFTVNPGDAVFLGEFKPDSHLAQIQAIAVRNNETHASGYAGTYYDQDIIPPKMTTPTVNSPDFLAAKRYEAQALPDLRGRLAPVVYKPARYETSTCLW